MAKEWNEGRNCVFTVDYKAVLAGTQAWVFKVSDTEVVFKLKTDHSNVTVELDQAENYVALKPGKPRKNWNFDDGAVAKPATPKSAPKNAPKPAVAKKVAKVAVADDESGEDEATQLVNSLFSIRRKDDSPAVADEASSDS